MGIPSGKGFEAPGGMVGRWPENKPLAAAEGSAAGLAGTPDGRGDQRPELRLGSPGHAEDLLHRRDLEVIGETHVGDHGDPQHPQTRMDSDDHLRHRRHADDIGADGPEEAVFGPVTAT